jgi:hypothetical protein
MTVHDEAQAFLVVCVLVEDRVATKLSDPNESFMRLKRFNVKMLMNSQLHKSQSDKAQVLSMMIDPTLFRQIIGTQCI